MVTIFLSFLVTFSLFILILHISLLYTTYFSGYIKWATCTL